MKVFRLLGLTVLGIILILVAAIVIATLVIDPNSYKPQIEKAVERSTRLDLTLAGDIDWSLIPLGLSLEDVSAELDGEPFARLDRLVAEVDFWSLLRFEPSVNTFVLEGMTANLTRDQEGQGNWERIMPEQAPEQADVDPAQDAAETEEQAAEPLQFQINEVRITNAELRYRDLATGQDLMLDQVDLAAQDIALGSSFPLDLSFHFATNQPELDVNGTISAAVEASEDLQRFSITDLSSNFDIEGEPLGDEPVAAGFSGAVNADLEAETATLSDFRAQLANLVLQSNLEVRGFGDTPQISGMFEIEPFSARELLDSLGQEPIETQDADVLNNVALETRIGGVPGELQLSDLVLTLDDTRFNGGIGYNLQTGAIAVDLQGDSLNLDRYLAPPTEDEAAAAQTGGDPASTPAADPELLPLETVRGLILDLRLGLEELIAQNLRINSLEVIATARDGLVRVNPISGNLYDGDFELTAELDARPDDPQWKINQRLNNVDTLPLLTDLAELDMISGKANLRADVTSRGNRLSNLRENAQGTASFTIDDGAFETINLTAYACQGIALANAETINTQDWPASTRFEDLSGVMRINGNILNNENLSADMAGMSLDGEGTINLQEMMLDYELGLRIVGAIHEHNACRVNERVQNIVIPIECRGSLEEPGEICSFDGSRFRDVLKDMAASEARRKAGQQVDKAAEKVDKEVDRQLDKILGEEKKGEEQGTRKDIKDAVRGLFGR